VPVVPRIRQFSPHRFRTYSHDRILEKWTPCRYCVRCVTSAPSSMFSPPISYHNRPSKPSPCSSMPIPTQREVHTGLSRTSDPNFRMPTTLIHTASYRSYPASRHSSNATARHGTITGDSCKALRPTSVEKYCCLFALYMDRGYTPQQFISLFNACDHADRQVERLFTAEFGAQMSRGVCVQCCRSCL